MLIKKWQGKGKLFHTGLTKEEKVGPRARAPPKGGNPTHPKNWKTKKTCDFPIFKMLTDFNPTVNNIYDEYILNIKVKVPRGPVGADDTLQYMYDASQNDDDDNEEEDDEEEYEKFYY